MANPDPGSPPQVLGTEVETVAQADGQDPNPRQVEVGDLVDLRSCALLGQGGDGHEGRVLELLSLMQEIQERSQRLLPHLNAVLAVQQSERRALRRGNEVLQGYRQPPGQTGRRISSTN